MSRIVKGKMFTAMSIKRSFLKILPKKFVYWKPFIVYLRYRIRYGLFKTFGI